MYCSTGGVDPTVRKDTWQFMFGLYPFLSTAREREVMSAEHHFKYHQLKARWKTLLTVRASTYVDATRSSVVTVFYCRQPINMKDIRKAVRIIDKDVPRTDRGHEYFKGSGNPHLSILRNILITFAAFHPKVGYAQGMNDILSRFLVVLDSEVEAFWCFSSYMETIQTDFMEEGMLRKLSGQNRVVGAPLNTDFTFELFVCVAMLQNIRQQLLNCRDGTEIFQSVSG
uniref:Rab-GAP TBC domain-containing protein n=1 Tax=Branchiostoma floridae TaxID=7739 RepID=C3Z4E2_BRAFL|eukprot:XP_002596519.1 hypothetical protein BRAFLDRAFT_231647 [Branchiostoma floridae]